jgi:hypothetical protein
MGIRCKPEFQHIIKSASNKKRTCFIYSGLFLQTSYFPWFLLASRQVLNNEPFLLLFIEDSINHYFNDSRIFEIRGILKPF